MRVPANVPTAWREEMRQEVGTFSFLFYLKGQKHRLISQKTTRSSTEPYFSKNATKQKHRLTSQYTTVLSCYRIFLIIQRKQKQRLTSQNIAVLSTQPYLSKNSTKTKTPLNVSKYHRSV